MGIWKEYFRRHPWQRRTILALLTVILGCLVGYGLHPTYRAYQQRRNDAELIERMGAENPQEAELAVQQAIREGRKREEFVHRLREALDTPSDPRFESLCYVLKHLGRFDDPTVDRQWHDRLRLLEFRAAREETPLPDRAPATPSAPSPLARLRRRLAVEALLCERDNPYIRQMLQAVSADPAPLVRETAAPLAARLGDDSLLAALLEDTDIRVQSLAALDAGLGGRTALADTIRRRWLQRRNRLAEPLSPVEIDRISSEAYALVLLEPRPAGDLLRQAVLENTDAELHDRLVLSLAVLRDDETARRTVQDLLHLRRWNRQPAEGVTLAVAADLRLPDASLLAAEVLRAAAEQPSQPVPVSTLLGALEALSAMESPCRAAVYELCRRLWGPEHPALLTRLALLLGKQALREEPDVSSPTKEQCLQLLRDAVQYSQAAADGRPIPTPLPSAAAAVALWRAAPAATEFRRPLDTNVSDPQVLLEVAQSRTSLFYLRQAILTDDPAAADFLAWHIARSGRAEVRRVAHAFLPSEGETPEYSPEVRACGAMMLAFSAADSAARRAAAERITRRLEKEEYPASGSLQCALLIAGRTERLPKVRLLLELEDFPAARALTAMLVAGDKTALDRLLWNADPNVPILLEDVPPLLIETVVGDVLRAAAPSLPGLCSAGSEATRLWQTTILQQAYGIRRAKLRLGLRP